MKAKYILLITLLIILICGCSKDNSTVDYHNDAFVAINKETVIPESNDEFIKGLSDNTSTDDEVTEKDKNSYLEEQLKNVEYNAVKNIVYDMYSKGYETCSIKLLESEEDEEYNEYSWDEEYEDMIYFELFLDNERYIIYYEEGEAYALRDYYEGE